MTNLDTPPSEKRTPLKSGTLQSAHDVLKVFDERDLKYAKVGVFDIDGILRGKLINRDKFSSSLHKGFGFCDVIFGWDSEDQLYDNVKFTGWHTGYPDAMARLLPETTRDLPFEFDGNGLLVLGEMDGAAESICPRGCLRRVLDRAKQMGYEVSAALEYEFFVFEETPDSVREKNYQNLNPITPGNFGYSVLRNSVWSEFYEALLELSEQMDLPIEGLHTETGPGVIEAALKYGDALYAADRAALFKTFVKILAQRHDLMATFMAKWSNKYPGQSGHIHISMRKINDGSSVFYDPSKPHNMSDDMTYFVSGQQMLMPQMLAMVSPTVNSYSRLIPGFWAPTHSAWGVENRTTALRVIPGSESAQRVEYRVAAADGNPYLALAAAIGSGLWGIENKVAPVAPLSGNAYEQDLPDKDRLPATLWEAAQNLKASTPARHLFGDDFVEHFAATREWEEREFRKAITDWELKRYFEII
jgi:glutamine synthetase